MTKLESDLTDEDSVDCHLQQTGMGGLLCRAAQAGEHLTNEVNPEDCFACPIGKVFREVGCDSITSKLTIMQFIGGHRLYSSPDLFCREKKRPTTYEDCLKCDLVTAETTRATIRTARELIESEMMYEARKHLQRGYESLQSGDFDTTIAQSVSCLESVLQCVHERFATPLPKVISITELWKSSRKALKLDELAEARPIEPLLGTTAGLVTHLGSLRNTFSDAHGHGKIQLPVSQMAAELAINLASALTTAVIRRIKQLEDTHEQQN